MELKDISKMSERIKTWGKELDEQFFAFDGFASEMTDVLICRLDEVYRRFGKVRAEYERQSVVAVANIYGIYRNEEEAEKSRQALLETWLAAFRGYYGKAPAKYVVKSVQFIISKAVIAVENFTVGVHVFRDENGFTFTYGCISPTILLPAWEITERKMFKRSDMDITELLRDMEADGDESEFDDLQPGEDVDYDEGLPYMAFSVEAKYLYTIREYKNPVELKWLFLDHRDY